MGDPAELREDVDELLSYALEYFSEKWELPMKAERLKQLLTHDGIMRYAYYHFDWGAYRRTIWDTQIPNAAWFGLHEEGVAAALGVSDE